MKKYKTQRELFFKLFGSESCYLSHISLYDRTLTEEEFSTYPMLFREYEYEKQAMIECQYKSVCNDILENVYTLECNYDDDDNEFYYTKEVFGWKYYFYKFLYDKGNSVFIDWDKSLYIIFYDYLEITIYSKDKWYLNATKTLIHQLLENERTKIEDTFFNDE